eukprot:810772-Lingulodinium_polyedra.AAC.1
MESLWRRWLTISAMLRIRKRDACHNGVAEVKHKKNDLSFLLRDHPDAPQDCVNRVSRHAEPLAL